MPAQTPSGRDPHQPADPGAAAPAGSVSPPDRRGELVTEHNAVVGDFAAARRLAANRSVALPNVDRSRKVIGADGGMAPGPDTMKGQAELGPDGGKTRRRR